MRFKKAILVSTLLTLGILLLSSDPLSSVKADTVNPNENQGNTFTLQIASYVYRKEGKQVHLDNLNDANGQEIKIKQVGSSSLIPKGTSFKYYGKPKAIKTYINTSSQTSTGDRKMYYSIGNGYYINAKNVGITNGPANITIDRNSYVYNSKGKRKKAKTIRRNTSLTVPGKFQETSTPKKYYSEYLSSSGIKFVRWQRRHRFWLNYNTIHGKQYYNIGKGQFIRADNVRYLDGKPVYTNAKETTVVLKHRQEIVNMKSNRESGRYYKKGKKLRVDKYISTFYGYPDDFWFKTGAEDSIFYHVKGTKDNWVSGRVSEVDVRRYIEPINVNNNKFTFIQFKPGITKGIIYDEHGEQKFDNTFFDAKRTDYNEFGYTALKAAELKYIYAPSSKKVELFYLIKPKDQFDFGLLDKDGKAVPRDPNMDNFYLKADDLNYLCGIKLKPINTVAEAEKDK